MVVSMFPRALVGPSFSAFIADNSAEENRGQVYGIVDTIYQITGIVGPPLGGFLAYRFGYTLMSMAAAILYTVAAGLRIWMATTMRTWSSHCVAPGRSGFWRTTAAAVLSRLPDRRWSRPRWRFLRRTSMGTATTRSS